jgi:N-formylglutamate amidohydrolase
VNRALYMDEAGYTKTAGFEKMKHDLGRVVEAVAAFTTAGLEPLPDAAE